MRTGKRALAGVAAGALALGMISFVGASTASAAGNIAGSPSPVRPGAYGAIPAATVSFAGASSSLTDDDTLVGYLVTAPPTGNLSFDDSAGVAASADDSISLARNNRTIISDTLGNGAGFFGANSDDDSTVSLTVDTVGQYVGGIGNGTDTVTFNFTTVGNPASMTLTPASQTVLVGETAELEVTLKDASGNVTQPATVDTIGLTDNTDDTIVAEEGSNTLITSVPAADMSDGVASVFLRTYGHPAGTTTVTATPQGTLISFGLTAQTATVTKSGTVTSASVADMAVTTPSNAINAGSAPGSLTAQVPSPTTSVTLTIDDTTVATAGNQIRLAATVGSLGSVNGVEDDTAYVLVTTDANKQATATFTLGGTAALSNGVLTVTQVDVLGAATSPTAKIVVSVKTPAVNPADVVPTPAGSITAVVGATTPVTVQVDDSFGTPISGWIVTAHRGSASGTVVGTGTTSSAGSAALSVSPLSTTVAGQNETYYFVATNPVLPSQTTTSSSTLQVNYETNADVTALSVAPSGNAAGAFSGASPTQTAYPVVVVPSGGTIGNPSSPSAGVYTVASASVTTAPTNNVLAFTVTTTPTNTVTVTAPEGVKVSSTAPTAGVTLWSAGSQSASITGNGSAKVYVWATKAGIHELTFASTGLEVKGKILVANTPADAYNISMTPVEQTIGTGAFGTVTVKVTDVFGNAVAGTSDDTGGVTVSATGDVRLGGFQSSQAVNTDTNGEATVSVIGGNSAGTGALTAVPTNGTASSNAPAFRPIYTPPTGAPAPVTSAAALVRVTAITTKSITITGERATVSGRSGILVYGVVTGIEDGKTVIPYIRFPGQTTFTAGSARPEITDGEFVWQRKTGKRVTVYVTNDDGAVRSNRVTIQTS